MTRPAIHLTGERGWINDPHGITWHDGRYHVFHQAIPSALEHSPSCSWGHAVSPDLLRFEHRPTALAPDADEDGIWTGSLATGEAGPRILYTAVSMPHVGIGRVRVATPIDESWDAWQKHDVVVHAPEDLDLIAFRDPFVRREGDGWRMTVGAASSDGMAMALTYRSDDLEAWSYDGIALSRSTREREPVWMGALWECPQMIAVDGQAAMVSSVWDDDVLHYAGFALGAFADGRFDAAAWGRLTWGTYYAPSCFVDAEGRESVMLWMRGVRGADWTSCLSVPHVLRVVDGALRAEPHPTVMAARGEEGSPSSIDGPIDVEWAAAEGEALTLAGSAGTTTVRVGDGQLEVEAAERWTMPWSGGPVRLIVDGPALEIASADGILGCPIAPPERVQAVGARLWRLDPR